VDDDDGEGRKIRAGRNISRGWAVGFVQAAHRDFLDAAGGAGSARPGGRAADSVRKPASPLQEIIDQFGGIDPDLRYAFPRQPVPKSERRSQLHGLREPDPLYLADFLYGASRKDPRATVLGSNCPRVPPRFLPGMPVRRNRESTRCR